MVKLHKRNIYLVLSFLCTTLLFNNCKQDGVSIKSSSSTSGANSLPSANPPPSQPPAQQPPVVVQPPPPVPVPQGSLKMFVAQGHAGRTIISCDKGMTWVANNPGDTSVDCGSSGGGCDHGPHNGMGVTGGNGYFVATWGHGGAGHVARSKDGVIWEKVLDSTDYDGVGYSNGIFVLYKGSTVRSNDDGFSWTKPLKTMTAYNIRSVGQTDIPGARFLADGDNSYVDGSNTYAMSDDGLVWSKAQSYPNECIGGYSYSYVGGNGIILKPFNNGKPGYQLSNGNGLICRSVDGGKNWTAHAVPNFWFYSKVIFDGTKFVTYGINQPHTGMKRAVSTDGINWQQQDQTYSIAPTGGNPVKMNWFLGSLAYGDGAFVASGGSYAAQKFYRSTDGITWYELPSVNYSQGHTIKNISYGVASKSATCQ